MKPKKIELNYHDSQEIKERTSTIQQLEENTENFIQINRDKAIVPHMKKEEKKFVSVSRERSTRKSKDSKLPLVRAEVIDKEDYLTEDERRQLYEV